MSTPFNIPPISTSRSTVPHIVNFSIDMTRPSEAKDQRGGKDETFRVPATPTQDQILSFLEFQLIPATEVNLAFPPSHHALLFVIRAKTPLFVVLDGQEFRLLLTGPSLHLGKTFAQPMLNQTKTKTKSSSQTYGGGLSFPIPKAPTVSASFALMTGASTATTTTRTPTSHISICNIESINTSVTVHWLQEEELSYVSDSSLVMCFDAGLASMDDVGFKFQLTYLLTVPLGSRRMAHYQVVQKFALGSLSLSTSMTATNSGELVSQSLAENIEPKWTQSPATGSGFDECDTEVHILPATPHSAIRRVLAKIPYAKWTSEKSHWMMAT